MNIREKLKRVEVQKAKIAFRSLFTLFMILAVSPLLAACATPIAAADTGEPTETIPAATPETSTSTAIMIPDTGLTETPTPPALPTVTQASDGSLTFTPDADARVKESDPSKNYGNGKTLQVDGGKDPNVESFLRFTVTGVSGPIQSAHLRLYVADDGSHNGPAVYATDNSWVESGITWDSRLAPTSDAVDNKEEIPTNAWVEYDVTSLVTGDGTFSFVLAADSSDGVVFSSREGDQSPQLVIRLGDNPALTPTPVSTPTEASTPTQIPTLADGSVVFVGAGDIAECGMNASELTAQLLQSIPGTVFTLGDNAYDKGTSTQYADCYDPTWGKFKDHTKPIPGNHEYMTSGASGYFNYFDHIAPYYAYDLGSWRIYALNSEIDVSATSDQLKWLQADLTANPRQCVLAYWHQPRWSSGTHHGSNANYETLWQTLFNAGAELVLNGHEHNYERFTPMNATGQADPQGMREFVVGTGGREHYGFGKILPTSEVQDSTSSGVLKLILRPTGYDWQFVPVVGSTFTDSGSAECH
ncbi:MAG TPA: DNRLRE domain-containing protein [Anaerolineales bacterium]|nr:DNRLRE domain-containing protein [Anaerolineales bacterium]